MESLIIGVGLKVLKSSDCVELLLLRVRLEELEPGIIDNPMESFTSSSLLLR